MLVSLLVLGFAALSGDAVWEGRSKAHTHAAMEGSYGKTPGGSSMEVVDYFYVSQKGREEGGGREQKNGSMLHTKKNESSCAYEKR